MKYQSRWKAESKKPKAEVSKPKDFTLKKYTVARRLTWYRWEWSDPVNSLLWTAATCSVYQPTYEHPFVSVLISIANGGGKVLFRCASLEEAQERVIIPEAGIARLQMAITKAHTILEDIREDLRLIHNSHTLADGGQIVRTDTGEILAQAERIIAEGL